MSVPQGHTGIARPSRIVVAVSLLVVAGSAVVRTSFAASFSGAIGAYTVMDATFAGLAGLACLFVYSCLYGFTRPDRGSSPPAPLNDTTGRDAEALKQAQHENQQLQEQVVGIGAELSALRDAHERLQRQMKLQNDLNNYQPRAVVDSGTPADKIMAIMNELLDGKAPSTDSIYFVMNTLQDARNIYQPVDFDSQLQSSSLEADVGEALARQLGQRDGPHARKANSHLRSHRADRLGSPLLKTLLRNEMLNAAALNGNGRERHMRRSEHQMSLNRQRPHITTRLSMGERPYSLGSGANEPWQGIQILTEDRQPALVRSQSERRSTDEMMEDDCSNRPSRHSSDGMHGHGPAGSVACPSDRSSPCSIGSVASWHHSVSVTSRHSAASGYSAASGFGNEQAQKRAETLFSALRDTMGTLWQGEEACNSLNHPLRATKSLPPAMDIPSVMTGQVNRCLSLCSEECTSPTSPMGIEAHIVVVDSRKRGARSPLSGNLDTSFAGEIRWQQQGLPSGSSTNDWSYMRDGGNNARKTQHKWSSSGLSIEVVQAIRASRGSSNGGPGSDAQPNGKGERESSGSSGLLGSTSFITPQLLVALERCTADLTTTAWESNASPVRKESSNADGLLDSIESRRDLHKELFAAGRSKAAGPASPLSGNNSPKCKRNKSTSGAALVVHVPPPLLDEVERVLLTAEEWRFNAFSLSDATNGHPLSTLAYYLFLRSSLIEQFEIQGPVLARFLRHIESGYMDHPYHNKTHAADVLQSIHVILYRGGMIPGFADPLILMACYLAAVVHDYEHVGCTNDYLINAGDPLALRYNDKAPMEHHHLAAAFRALKNPELNFLSHLPKCDFDKLRKTVIDMVLMTDMKQHFTIISQFNTSRSAASASNSHHGSTSSLNQARHQKRTATQLSSEDVELATILSIASGGGASDVTDAMPPVPYDDAERLLCLQMALKCADLGHLSADLNVHLKWVSRLEEEFFRQGDLEKLHNIPVSPLFDRTKKGVSKSQVGFLDIVAIPLFRSFTQVFSGASPMLANVMQNYNYWKAQELQEQQQQQKQQQ